MKRLEGLALLIRAAAMAAAPILLLSHANAERILNESFETPVVLDGAATDPDGWSTVGHPSYVCAANESGQSWATPYGEQGMSTYGSGVGTCDLGYLPEVPGEYILKFNITSSSSIGEYRAEFVTQQDWFGDLQPPVIVAATVGDTDGSKNMSYTGQIKWRYIPTPDPVWGELIPTKLLIKLMQDPERSNWRHTPIWDNVTVDWIPDVDTKGPLLLDIADDNQGGAVVAANSVVTYTVTFNEPMDPLTVDTSDFGNAGGAAASIESVTPTADAARFLVSVRPTSEGTLRLEIQEGADLADASGNAMDTVLDVIQDTETFNVESGTPILQPTDFVDHRAGLPVKPGMVVTYTVTFSEDMDAASVTGDDFENAGTAYVPPGTILVAETSPTSGTFTVQVTPSGSGTLQLQVKQAVLLESASGGILNTGSAIADDTIITVDGDVPFLTDITDEAGGGSVALGTLVTYNVFFSEDVDASTVSASDFGNAVISGGAPFTIDTIEEVSPGVFRIELTPTAAGSIQFQVNSAAAFKDVAGNELVLASPYVDDTVVTVTTSNPYNTWSGGLAFDTDENGDGLADGLAWLLGASAPGVNAVPHLPATSVDGSGNLVLSFRCLKTADRGGASLKVQYRPDLGSASGASWSDYQAEVPDTDATVNGIVFDTTDEGGVIHVLATIPAQPGNKVFARLSGELP